jgi:hypothetical protein
MATFVELKLCLKQIFSPPPWQTAQSPGLDLWALSQRVVPENTLDNCRENGIPDAGVKSRPHDANIRRYLTRAKVFR